MVHFSQPNHRFLFLKFALLVFLFIFIPACGNDGGEGEKDPDVQENPEINVPVQEAQNSIPIAHAGDDQNVTPGTQVFLNGSRSSDADGDNVSYTWSFSSTPAGSNVTLDDSGSMTPSFTPDTAGTYIINLVVSDGFESSDISAVTVTVAATETANRKPTADAGADQIVPSGSPAVLDGSNSSDPDGDTLTFSWFISSQPQDSRATLNASDSPSPELTPDVTGEYSIGLIVNDGQANSTSDYVTIKTCTDSDQDGFHRENWCGTNPDCDDDNGLIHPEAIEICDDGVDNNCDGFVDCLDSSCSADPVCQTCTDADNDGFYAESDCGTPVDCLDSNPDVNQNAVEACDDSIDNDCDGWVDEGCTGYAIHGLIHHQGVPMHEITTSEAHIWCRNESTGQLFENAAITYNPEDSTYEILNLSGSVGVCISYWVTGSTRTLPGNYRVWEYVEEADAGALNIDIDLLVHLVEPFDNSTITTDFIDDYPYYESPLYFSWDAVPGATDYLVNISTYRDPDHPQGWGSIDNQVYEVVQDTFYMAPLALSNALEHYQFTLYAYNNSGRIGYYITTYTNGFGWDYRFTIDSTSGDMDLDGFSAEEGDCDDGDQTIFPGADEICGDGIDQDCNGSDLSCSDVDNDGDGFTENDGDCDDTVSQIHPQADEVLTDGKDNDCDGTIDEGGPTGDYKNSLGMTFNLVPSGNFTMGSPLDELGRSENEIAHQVTLTYDFFIQTTEVTQAQWESVMGANPSFHTGCPDCPVEAVDSNDVEAFLNIINEKGEGIYRLPTEAEWEYAARAGSETAFANGDITETGCGYEPNLSVIGWYCDNADGSQPVALKESNAWGLFDMHGNVAEMCSDWYGDYPTTAQVDPTGPESGDYKILRGGSSWHSAMGCRSAYRTYKETWIAGNYFGLRLVRQQSGDLTAWYKDDDQDGYSDGTIRYSESRPSGVYYDISELTSPSGDCDDNDGGIHPGAREIPGDGIDQDCDGEDLHFTDMTIQAPAIGTVFEWTAYETAAPAATWTTTWEALEKVTIENQDYLRMKWTNYFSTAELELYLRTTGAELFWSNTDTPGQNEYQLAYLGEVGDSWQVYSGDTTETAEIEAAGVDITVPYGTFKAYIYAYKYSGVLIRRVAFVPNLGMIRYWMYSYPEGMELTDVLYPE